MINLNINKDMIPMDFGVYTCTAKRGDGVVSTNSIKFRRDRDSGSGFEYDIEHLISTSEPVVVRPSPVVVEAIRERPAMVKEREHSSIGNINDDRTIRILEEFQTYTHEGE